MTAYNKATSAITKGSERGCSSCECTSALDTVSTYFAEDGDIIVVLLCGGDKSTQARDVERAQQYWNDYKERLQ